MSDNDVARTKRYMQTLCLGDMAKPLRLSLLISSTILFSTRLLSNTRYDKVQVLEVRVSFQTWIFFPSYTQHYLAFD